MSGDTGVVWFLRTSEQDLGTVRVISVDGRISRATAAGLGRAVLAAHSGNGLRGIVVDLSGVDYINGAGLQEFEHVAARLSQAGIELLICGVQPAVRAVFDLAGAIPNLSLVESRDAAVNRCERPAAGRD